MRCDLFGGPFEDRVNDVKSDHPAADHRAGSDGAPQDVGAGKIPNGQQAGNHGDQNTGTRRPERQLRYYPWIEKPSSHLGRRCYFTGTIAKSARTSPSSVTAISRRGRCLASSPNQTRSCKRSPCASSVCNVTSRAGIF
jgi:hypothetical protein